MLLLLNWDEVPVKQRQFSDYRISRGVPVAVLCTGTHVPEPIRASLLFALAVRVCDCISIKYIFNWLRISFIHKKALRRALWPNAERCEAVLYVKKISSIKKMLRYTPKFAIFPLLTNVDTFERQLFNYLRQDFYISGIIY